MGQKKKKKTAKTNQNTPAIFNPFCSPCPLQSAPLTLWDTGLDAVLQDLLQRVVESADGSGVQHFHQEGHLAPGWVVGNSVVPRVRHTLLVDAEHAGGLSVQLAWSSLDVILCVVLTATRALSQVMALLKFDSKILCLIYNLWSIEA